jgi:rhamnogalacturonan endolyase
MALHALLATALFAALPRAALTARETAARINIANDRFALSFNKSLFVIDSLSLDGQDLLGSTLAQKVVPGGPTGHGIIGLGPYLDCYCAREGSGSYTPGVARNSNASVELIRGAGDGYAGFVLRDVHKLSGQRMEFYVFLRDGETGLHTFGRVAYTEPRGPTRKAVQEFRTLFAPNSPLWTHLVTNEKTIAPMPRRENLKNAAFVQDATKDLRPFPDDPFVKDTNGYFTKYSFADEWKDHELHGLYGDGKTVGNGSWGAWMVQWNRETYYGGPIRQDLTVDGIIYDYMGKKAPVQESSTDLQVSNHYGANVPNITVGFDRTFGPVRTFHPVQRLTDADRTTTTSIADLPTRPSRPSTTKPAPTARPAPSSTPSRPTSPTTSRPRSAPTSTRRSRYRREPTALSSP